jgi:hypothetical protein
MRICGTDPPGIHHFLGGVVPGSDASFALSLRLFEKCLVIGGIRPFFRGCIGAECLVPRSVAASNKSYLMHPSFLHTLHDGAILVAICCSQVDTRECDGSRWLIGTFFSLFFEEDEFLLLLMAAKVQSIFGWH